MGGLTGFASGLMNNKAVYIPIPKLVSTSPRSMDPFGTTWEQILAMTGQPNTSEIRLNGETKAEMEEPRMAEPSLH